VAIVLVQRVLDVPHVLIQLAAGDHRILVPEGRHRTAAIDELGVGDRPAAILRPPIHPGGHPDRKGLRPVFVRVLLGIPAGKMAHVSAAERLGPVLFEVGLGDAAELLDPLLLVV
jgi:hypothetical protein